MSSPAACSGSTIPAPTAQADDPGLGFVVWGAALIAFGLAHSFAAVVAAVAIWAVALASISGTASPWLVDHSGRWETIRRTAGSFPARPAPAS